MTREFHNSGNLDDLDELEEDEEESGLGHNAGMEPDEVLDNMEFQDLQLEARKSLMLDLIKLLRAGQATPAEKNTLRQMLKDNGCILGDPLHGPGQSYKQSQQEPERRDGPEPQKRPLPTFERPKHLG